MQVNGQWYVLSVRSRWEKRAQAALRAKGYEVLLPLHSDGLMREGPNEVEQDPIFPGYLFLRFDCLNRAKILTTPGALGIITFGGRWAQVDEREIWSVKSVITRDVPRCSSPFPPLGAKVRVESGPLKGVEGQILQGPRRVVICISLIERSMAVILDRSTLVSQIA